MDESSDHKELFVKNKITGEVYLKTQISNDFSFSDVYETDKNDDNIFLNRKNKEYLNDKI